MTTEEKAIVLAIAQTHPYTYADVCGVYEACKSFDATVGIIEKAREYGTSLNYQIERHAQHPTITDEEIKEEHQLRHLKYVEEEAQEPNFTQGAKWARDKYESK